MKDELGGNHPRADWDRVGCLFDLELPAMTEEERASVIRECIDALPKFVPDEYQPWKDRRGCFVDGLTCAHTALEALLPKPDPAKELVEEWKASLLPDESADLENWEIKTVARAFAWLLHTGKIKEA